MIKSYVTIQILAVATLAIAAVTRSSDVFGMATGLAAAAVVVCIVKLSDMGK